MNTTLPGIGKGDGDITFFVPTVTIVLTNVRSAG